MTDNTAICPRCKAELDELPLYQCCRCFIIYCQHCPDTNNGKICPKCKMEPKLILRTN